MGRAVEFECQLSDEGALEISAVIIGLLVGMKSAANDCIEPYEVLIWKNLWHWSPFCSVF